MPGMCHLILGPMFAKKTTRVIAYKRRLDRKGSITLIFKHFWDTRYDDGDQVTSHDKDSEKCISIRSTNEIFKHPDYKDAHVIIIEEGQFFSDDNFVEDCRHIVNNDGKYLIVSALSGDFEMRPFGHVHELLCIASSVEMATACCNMSEDVVDASYTAKISGSENQTEVGVDKYIPVCRKYHLEHSNNALHVRQEVNSERIRIRHHGYVKRMELENFPEGEYILHAGMLSLFRDSVCDTQYHIEDHDCYIQCPHIEGTVISYIKNNEIKLRFVPKEIND